MTHATNMTDGVSHAAASGTGITKNITAARVVLISAGPVCIGLVCLLGWLVLVSFNIPVCQRELFAAAIISIASGFLAILPMLIWIGKGAVAVVRLTMLVMLLRMGLTLAGLFLALGPGWRLSAGPLVVWTSVCYLALMVGESLATIWATRH